MISGYWITHNLSTNNKKSHCNFFSSLSHTEEILTLAFWPNSNYLTSFFLILLTTFSNYSNLFILKIWQSQIILPQM